MSEHFIKEIENLHNAKAISDFEFKQLLCLNSIMGSLVGIDTNLDFISKNLGEIKHSLDQIAVK